MLPAGVLATDPGLLDPPGLAEIRSVTFVASECGLGLLEPPYLPLRLLRQFLDLADPFVCGTL